MPPNSVKILYDVTTDDALMFEVYSSQSNLRRNYYLFVTALRYKESSESLVRDMVGFTISTSRRGTDTAIMMLTRVPTREHATVRRIVPIVNFQGHQFNDIIVVG
jgi:hypothetical protein